jgi:predicted transcriptional regulator
MVAQLSEQEKIVLDSVQEFLDKNRSLEFRKVIPFISSRFKFSSIMINENGIRIALTTLIEKRFILQGSKLTRKTALNNKKRNMLYNFIVKNPGIYFKKITTDLNLNNHVAIWHLKTLVEFNLIKKEKFKNHYIYFEQNLRIENAVNNFYTLKEKSRKIIDFLKINDIGVSRNKIAQSLGMHSNTINKYMDELEAIGLVSKKKLPKKTLYFLNENKKIIKTK